MRRIPAWLLPLLLVLNSLTSVAIATRAVELRRGAQVWDLRAGAWLELGTGFRRDPDRSSVEARRAGKESGQSRRRRHKRTAQP